MRKIILILALVATSLIGADLTGRWEFQVETDAGSGTPTFVLKQEGEKLSGTYSGALGNAEVTGSIMGSKLTITFEVSGSKILYEGVIEKDGTIKGTVDLGGQAKGTFTGSRNK